MTSRNNQALVTKAVRARVATLAAVGILYPVAALGAALCATSMFSGPAYAAEAAAVQTVGIDHAAAKPAAFQKKSFSLDGSVSVERRGERTVLVFSDDFRTKRGPDLKVFLSTNSVSDATGVNATVDAVRLGALSSNRGGQEYILPEGVNIADYSSVLVHCEAFSKLWGGADI
ncbi:MAG: DM13 domain-containing protein [Pseudomonadota bacterium]